MVFRLCLLCLPLALFGKAGYEAPWGSDAHLATEVHTSIPPVPKKNNLAVRCAEKVLLFRQNILSPVDGPRSHFRPTSSRYMLLSMKRHGFFQGFIMGCDRLLRENKEPWVYRTRIIDGFEYKWDPSYKALESQKKATRPIKDIPLFSRSVSQ